MKDTYIRFRLSSKLKAELKKKAKALDKTVSEYIRMLIS